MVGPFNRVMLTSTRNGYTVQKWDMGLFNPEMMWVFDDLDGLIARLPEILAVPVEKTAETRTAPIDSTPKTVRLEAHGRVVSEHPTA